MSDEYEQVFSEEAQEETILSQSQSYGQDEISAGQKNSAQTETTETQGSSSETSPLLKPGDNVRNRQPYNRADKSYQRAIDEPWNGAHGHGDRPWYKKPSIFWLLPAFFPFCIAFGGILVPKTYLVLNLICQDYFSDRAAKDPTFSYLPVIMGQDNRQCKDPEVQRLVSYFNAYSDFLAGFFSAIVAPFVGALSDRIGRRKVIACASMGGFVGETITIIVGRNPQTVSVYWLLAGSLADGLSGSFTTALALSFAYASDCTDPAKRAVAFGYFHATLFSGIALGPVVAGLLIKLTNNLLLPFYLALICHVIFILFTAFIVPESLSEERQVIAREKHAKERAELAGQPWSIKRYNIFKPLWVLRPRGEGSSPKLRRNLLVIAAIDTLSFGVAMGTMRIIILYSQYRFDWNAVNSSYFMSAANVSRVTGLVLILPLLTRIFRGRFRGQSSGHNGSDMLDINIIKMAVVLEIIGYFGYALAPNGTFLVLSGIITALGGMGSPTLQSSLTKHMPAHMTGQILGASGLLHALARVVAPLSFYIIYAETVGVYASAVFLCLGSIFIFIFILTWFLRPGISLRDESSMDREGHQSSTDDASP